MTARVLVIDDNHDLAESLAEILEIEGFETDIAHNGAETWEKLQSNQYQYCLTDIKLPDTNGIEIYNRAKASIPEHHITAISGFRIEQIISSVFHTDTVTILNLDADSGALGRAAIKPGTVTLLLCNTDRQCLDEDRLTEYGFDKYQLINSYSDMQDEINQAGETVFIINVNKPAIHSLSLAYEIHKNNKDAGFIIMLPSSTGLQGNPLQTYELTGILFKPFNMADFMELLAQDSQVTMTLNQG